MPETPHPIDVHVGRRLRLRRSLMGLSQEKLAELVGVTFQQIQKYERGTNRIGSSRLYRLAQVLQVPVSYFFEGLEAPTAGTPGLAESPASFEHESAPLGPRPLVDRRETLELVRAFNRIRNPVVRRRIYELTKALAALECEDTS